MYLHNLQTVLADFKSSQTLILSRWMQKHYVVRFLQKYRIKPAEFIDGYALRLISNTILMIENEFEDNRYLICKEMLFDFADRDITPYDIFCLYQAVKDVSIELIEEGDILSSTLLLNRDRIIVDIYRVFEYMTKDILHFYAEEFHHAQESLPA